MYILIDGLHKEHQLLKDIADVLQAYYIGKVPKETTVSVMSSRAYDPEVVRDETQLESALHLMDLTKSYLEETMDVTRELQKNEHAVAIRVGSPISMHVWFSGVLAENMKSELFYHILPRFEDLAGLEVPDTLVFLDCINPAEGDVEEMEHYRNVMSVVPGGMAYMNLVREFEENRENNRAVHYRGIKHPTSRKALYGSLVHVPYDRGEPIHHLAPRLIAALASSPVEGKHLVEFPMEEFTKKLIEEKA